LHGASKAELKKFNPFFKDEQEDEGPRGEEEGRKRKSPDREQQQQRRQVCQRLGHESSDEREKDFKVIVSIFSAVVAVRAGPHFV